MAHDELLTLFTRSDWRRAGIVTRLVYCDLSAAM